MLSPTAEKIQSFANLPVGWHYGSGVPASLEVVRQATLIYALILTRGFVKTGAFPGHEGEIQVTGYHDDIYVQVEVKGNDLFDFTYEVGDETIVGLDDILLEEVALQIGLIHIPGM